MYSIVKLKGNFWSQKSSSTKTTTMTTPAKLYGRELSTYDEVDVDELLSKLTQEELTMLAKEVDPDVSNFHTTSLKESQFNKIHWLVYKCHIHFLKLTVIEDQYLFFKTTLRKNIFNNKIFVLLIINFMPLSEYVTKCTYYINLSILKYYVCVNSFR